MAGVAEAAAGAVDSALDSAEAVDLADRSAAAGGSEEAVVVDAGRHCPNCGAEIGRRAAFCPSCGSRLAMASKGGVGVGKILGGLLLVLVLGGLMIGGCVYSGYNRAIGMDEEVKGAWAQVENQLQRRYEMIPNLVETVKGFAQQEKDVFLGIAKSREAYVGAKTVAEKAEAASAMESALSRLLVIRESYPELRSNESFLKLQDSLEGTENRLATERQRYNDRVKELNTFTRRFPGSLYASLAKVEKAEYFEIGEAARTAPKVDFSPPPTKG